MKERVATKQAHKPINNKRARTWQHNNILRKPKEKTKDFRSHCCITYEATSPQHRSASCSTIQRCLANPLPPPHTHTHTRAWGVIFCSVAKTLSSVAVAKTLSFSVAVVKTLSFSVAVAKTLSSVAVAKTLFFSVAVAKTLPFSVAVAKTLSSAAVALILSSLSRVVSSQARNISSNRLLSC